MVQTVLLYGSESWVVTDLMLEVLEGFHYRVEHRISGMKDHQIGEEGWKWSSVAEALEEAVLWPMKEHIQRLQATIT